MTNSCKDIHFLWTLLCTVHLLGISNFMPMLLKNLNFNVKNLFAGKYLHEFWIYLVPKKFTP